MNNTPIVDGLIMILFWITLIVTLLVGFIIFTRFIRYPRTFTLKEIESILNRSSTNLHDNQPFPVSLRARRSRRSGSRRSGLRYSSST